MQCILAKLNISLNEELLPYFAPIVTKFYSQGHNIDLLPMGEVVLLNIFSQQGQIFQITIFLTVK